MIAERLYFTSPIPFPLRIRLRKPLSLLLCPMSEHWGKWSLGCCAVFGPVGRHYCASHVPSQSVGRLVGERNDRCVAAPHAPMYFTAHVACPKNHRYKKKRFYDFSYF